MAVLDALVAFNPAAVVTNIADLKRGGLLIVNSDSFDAKDLGLAGLDKNPLEDGTVACYVTDFPNDALVRHEKVLPVPHLGASTPEAEDNCAVMAVRQVRD